jgi:hypothetical protein
MTLVCVSIVGHSTVISLTGICPTHDVAVPVLREVDEPRPVQDPLRHQHSAQEDLPRQLLQVCREELTKSKTASLSASKID